MEVRARRVEPARSAHAKRMPRALFEQVIWGAHERREIAAAAVAEREIAGARGDNRREGGDLVP